jgi:gem associated protein 5
VEIFTIPDLKIVCTLKSFQKLIQSLAWHPFITGGDAITEASKLQHYLAVASNEYDIHVWNLETVLTTPHDNSVLSKPDIVLSGHMLRVISVIWNPNEDGKLLSVSYDGTAEVWDVLEAKGQANFRGHSGRVFCGLWSPADKNIVLTGAEDCMVMGWNVLEQPETVPIKKSNNKKTYNREKKASMALAHNTNSAPADEIQVALELLEAKKAEIVTKNSDEAIHADSRPQKKKLNKRNYFGLAFASEAANRDKAFEDCSILVNNDLSLVQQRPHLAFFGPDILPHLKLEAENVVTSSKGYFYDDDNSVAHLLQWSGNTGEAVEKAIEAERLSDWLVSLAASTSYSLWRSACQTYAKQLAKKDNPVKSASYFLMVSEVAEAIDVLRKANFFQAAISIAKSRLPPDSPIIKDLFRQWAHQASLDGMVELASKCWLASGDLEKAASSLAKRSDGASLRVASSIMAKAGEAEKARVLAFQAMEELKKSNDLDGLQLLAKETTIEEVRDKIESV